MKMTARQYLGQAFWIKQNIQTKYEEIAELRSIAEKCTSSITGMPGGSHESDKLSGLVAKIVDKQIELGDEVQRQINLLNEIEKVIADVESAKHREVLEQRYLAFGTWDTIANRLCYEKRWVYKIHEEALGMVKIPRKTTK